MGIEIERKFLVNLNKLPPALATKQAVRIVQGYLSSDPSVRIRHSFDLAKDKKEAWITVKGPGLMSRLEFEYPVPSEDALTMLTLCSAILTKSRRKIRIGAKTWELDQFHGDLGGLWLAEIELIAADEVFDKPEWLGEEVTLDPRYTNGALARTQKVPDGLG